MQEESDIDTDGTQSGPEDESVNMQVVNITTSTSSPSPPTSRSMSHGAAIAARRGLHIRTERQRRTSLPAPSGPGLPISPRPVQKFTTVQTSLSNPPSSSS